MTGLYYHQDNEGNNFLWFYPDGRVMSFGKAVEFAQTLQTFPWYNVDSDTIHYSRGIYHIDIWDNIRVVIKSDFGKLEYRDFIRDEDTIDLFSRSPFTCAKKSATFVRCTLPKDIIDKELGHICFN